MLDCRDISIAAGDFALTGIDLQVESGQWATVMGSTGCGKTTLLEAICGLREVTGGSIHIGGVNVTRLAPRSRGIGLVPQDGALFAGMRVETMLALPLRARGVGRADRARRASAMAERLGMAHLLRRTAHGLSGGERQRVALGRALLCEPTLLCLDEPLSALDGETRASIRKLLLALRDTGDVSVLHVTHDQQEATAMAHTIWHMEYGVLTRTNEANNVVH